MGKVEHDTRRPLLNLYVDFADLVAARRAGVPPDLLAAMGPDATAGAEGHAFIDACLASAARGGWVDVAPV